SDPTLSARYAYAPSWGVLRIWQRERCGRSLRFDKFVRNEFGQPKAGPGARRGEPHGWGEQSLAPRQRDADRSAPLWGVLRIWRRERCGRSLWFDKFVRNEFGQPKAGPGARSAEG